MSRFLNCLCALQVCLLAIPAAFAQGEAPRKQTVKITMRDGTPLTIDLHMPVDYSQDRYPDGVPVVLVCTPYGKDREKPVGKWRACFVSNGYGFAVQDMRGFHASAIEGKAGPRHHDGYDTVEWLAEQPWSNGKVGMLGYSHLGAAQYETAVTHPPHLACAIPAQAPGNYYTDAFHPPKFRKADMETILRGRFTSRTKQLLNRRIRQRNRSQIGQVKTPMIHSAGWYDFYKEGAIEMFRACQHHGGPGARGKQKLFIGPWGHGVLQEEYPGKPLALPGGLVYPANSKLDWGREFWLPWFDYWCKGKTTGVMDRPAVKYYLMGDVDHPDGPGNEWVEADDFPPKSTPVPYYIHADHTLRREAPLAQSASMRYRYDPRDPVPTVGRRHVRMPVKGPHDQQGVEGRADVLVFTTPELKTRLQIVGRIHVKLWASSDREDTDFTAKLTDVYPDGRSMIFADGIVKARYRDTFLKEAFLVPDRVYAFEIDLGHIAIVLAAGHRLRLAISSSNFDRFDINPNTGEPYGDHAITRSLLAQRFGAETQGEPEYTAALVATNSIHMDRAHPSHVILPVTPLKDGGGTGAAECPRRTADASAPRRR